MDGIYRLLEYMSGRPVYSVDIPAKIDRMRPILLDQHPELAEIDVSGVNETNLQSHLDAISARFGETLSVHPEAETMRISQ